MIDQFTLEDFEKFLESQKPSVIEPLGLVDGEYCYKIILDGQASIMLRSSIGANGIAKGSGKDSIRLWLVGNDGKPLGSKIDSWTTRVNGWQTRLNNKICELVKRRVNAGDCRKCQKPFKVFRPKEVKRILSLPHEKRVDAIRKSKLRYSGKLTPEAITKWLKSDKVLFCKCFSCNENGNLDNEGWLAPASQMEASNDIDNTTARKQMAYSERKNEAHNDGKLLSSHLREECPIIIPENNISETKENHRSLQELPEKTGLDEFLADPFGDEPKQSAFKPSKYQEAIYEFVKNGFGHGVVSGVAGCGKTTTNVEALKLVPRTAKIKYAAFNKHIERDISAKAPSYVSVSTFHSWGLNNIKKAYPKIKINQWKVHNLIDDKSPNVEREFKNEIVKAISLLKGNLLDPTQDNIMQVTRDFGLDIAENDCGFIRQVFYSSIEDFNEIDFDDMIYYPASGIVSCEKFDYIFVDEAQDMNTAQYVLSKKSLAPKGRMLLIGDSNQSIYAFRGAHIGIMDFMADEMNATKLPLTISYRAPLAIVSHVNAHYPHIKFEAAETAKNGKIEWIGLDQFYSLIDQKDGVLCRTNAPLVEPCFSLIRRGIKAAILGKDIGAGLIKLIERREKLRKVNDLDSLLEQVDVYCFNEIRKAIRQKKEARAAMLQDQVDTIYALSAECETIRDLKSKTKAVFSNQQEGVTFSTVHKAKGLEWERVFVLGPKGNHPMGDEAQETNIRYVRDTRTLDELYFVEE